MTHRRDVGASMLVRAFASAGAVCGYRGDEKSAARWFARAQQVAGDETAPGSVISPSSCRPTCTCTMVAAKRRPGCWPSLHPCRARSGRGGTPPSGQRRWAAEPLTRPRSSWKAVPYSRAVLARARGEIEIAHTIFQESGAVYQAARTALLLSGSTRDQALATYKRLGLSVGALTSKDTPPPP